MIQSLSACPAFRCRPRSRGASRHSVVTENIPFLLEERLSFEWGHKYRVRSARSNSPSHSWTRTSVLDTQLTDEAS